MCLGSRPVTRRLFWWRILLRPTVRSWLIREGAPTWSLPLSEACGCLLLTGNTRILHQSSHPRPASLPWWLYSPREVTPPSYACLRHSAGTPWAISCPTWTWTTTTSPRRGPAPSRPPPQWLPCPAESPGLTTMGCKVSKVAYQGFEEDHRDPEGGYWGSKEGYAAFRGFMNWGGWSPAVVFQQPSLSWVGVPPSRPGCWWSLNQPISWSISEEPSSRRVPVCSPPTPLSVYSTHTANSRALTLF